jgi:hypothetical protein
VWTQTLTPFRIRHWDSPKALIISWEHAIKSVSPWVRTLGLGPWVCVLMAGLTCARWLLNVQQVCSLSQPQSSFSPTQARWGCLNQPSASHSQNAICVYEHKTLNHFKIWTLMLTFHWKREVLSHSSCQQNVSKKKKSTREEEYHPWSVSCIIALCEASQLYLNSLCSIIKCVVTKQLLLYWLIVTLMSLCLHL